MADHMSVGGMQKEKARNYTNHIISIDRPTWVYIFSDGYQDQFGSKTGNKFLLKNLKDVLLANHQKPMAEQQQLLESVFKEWIGQEFMQMDDVLLIGFKVDGSNRTTPASASAPSKATLTAKAVS
jgi:hypothetical protein